LHQCRGIYLVAGLYVRPCRAAADWNFWHELDFRFIAIILPSRLSVAQIGVQIALVAVVLATAFLLLVRPQLARIAKHRDFLASLKIGDHVTTRGGLIGHIVSFDGNAVVGLRLNAAEPVVIEMERSAIDGWFRRNAGALTPPAGLP
jgi:preprotein translocase YajC subunit